MPLRTSYSDVESVAIVWEEKGDVNPVVTIYVIFFKKNDEYDAFDSVIGFFWSILLLGIV